MSDKINKDWYRVNFENCFYDDMVGFVVEIKDRVIILNFGVSVGCVAFYKDQLDRKSVV